jgi:hypothetical protein
LEKIVEALALTLPSGTIIGGNGNNGTVSSGNLDVGGTGGIRYDDYCIRELAFDLGVNHKVLK